MTVFLVLGTILFFLGLDYLKSYLTGSDYVHSAVSHSDVMYDARVGYTMADGGVKLKSKKSICRKLKIKFLLFARCIKKHF